MIKQKLKYFISGFLVSTLLFSSLTVFGESIEKTIKVVYNQAKIYVNGNLVDLKDGNGKKVEPFVFNGTTFLPVRAISEALNQNVEWDAKNNSIYIGKAPNKQPSVWLDEMDYSDERKTSAVIDRLGDNNNDTDNAGTKHQHGLIYGTYIQSDSNSRLSRTYTLDQKYTKLTGVFALTNPFSSTDTKTMLKIYGDDRLLFASKEMTEGVMPEEVNVDVTGVTNLIIVFSGGGNNADLGFYDAGLWK